MNPVRIGCVKYLNTLPLIEGLRTWSGCALVSAAPSALIGMLLRNEVDVALASVIDAARGHGVTGGGTSPVVLLPVGMIGCNGPTLTVRVFSRTPLESVEEVAVDADSHTSVCLLQVLLWKMYGRRVRVREHDFAASPERPEAMLLIGDKVVTAAPDAQEYRHTLDLGEAWKALTGLPFVYAVWMCRDGEDDTRAVRAAAAMLDRTRRHNATRLDWIVATRAEDKGWKPDRAAEYLGRSLTYAVGEPEREAVEKFIRWSRELGLCDAAVRWAECGDAPVTGSVQDAAECVSC